MSPVALNGRFSGTRQPTGTQTAAFQLFDAVIRAPRDIPLVVFCDQRFEGISAWRDFPGVRLVDVPFLTWSRRRAHWWEQVELPRLARQQGCRVAHHPITTCPVWQNGLRHVVTLHDLNFYRHPEWYSRAFRLVYAVCAVPGLRRAARVVTISRYVETQAQSVLGLRPDRLAMVYNGVKPLPTTHRESGRDYLLCVGSLQPHKNLSRMIRAFQLVQNEYPDLTLHVVGRPQPRFTGDSELPALLAAPGVRVLGYLSERALAAEYAGARAFCYPSLEEGFGLPILEAMGLGVPVLTSQASCLPEVAGPAAVLVDPLCPEAIAAGVTSILRRSPEASREIQRLGREWAGRFSWARAAGEYLAIYRGLLS